MLAKTHSLLNELNRSGLRYCHWKSNASLSDALEGETDIDLLVHRGDANAFRMLLSQLNFRPALMPSGEAFPSVEHYIAFDETSGALIDLHAYYRVVTGESLTKNYRFPIEEMLLQNTRQLYGVRVPTQGSELIVFVLRMMLKHTSPVELALLLRDWSKVPEEIAWLLDGDPLDETQRLLKNWLPSLDPTFFSICLDALRTPAPLSRRIVLGQQMRARLGIYTRHSALRAGIDGMKRFALMAMRRLIPAKKGVLPLSGGLMIAFVGPEATGKTTLITEVRRWLSKYFAVEYVHVGKPKSTWLTMAPNLLLPALRSLLPSQRSGHIETQDAQKEQKEHEDSQKAIPLLFAIRSALLAYDRRVLLTGAYRRASNGAIIVCDRYPSRASGAPDSPQLQHRSLPREQYPFRHWLARVEKHLYNQIPPPDLIISLTVPVEVAIQRNRTRGKMEPEDYVRLRHAQSSTLEFGEARVFKVNTDQPLEQTVLEIKHAIWALL